MAELWETLQIVMLETIPIIGAIEEMVLEDILGVEIASSTDFMVVLCVYMLIVYGVGIIPYFVIFKKVNIELVTCLKPFYRTFVLGDVMAGRGYRKLMVNLFPHIVLLMGLLVNNIHLLMERETAVVLDVSIYFIWIFGGMIWFLIAVVKTIAWNKRFSMTVAKSFGGGKKLGNVLFICQPISYIVLANKKYKYKGRYYYMQ